MPGNACNSSAAAIGLRVHHAHLRLHDPARTQVGHETHARAVYQGFPPLGAADVAEAIFWCATLPEHVNVNRLELMSVMQSFAGFSVKRAP